MARFRFSSVAVVVLAVALTAVVSTGITYAATSSSGAKACVTSGERLGLLTKAGKCPNGYHAATIGAVGPKGPPGVAGKKGATGPAQLPHVYSATEGVGRSFAAPIISLTHLPAGTYEITFQVTVAQNAGPDATLGVDCFTSVGSRVLTFSGDVDVTQQGNVTGIGVAAVPADSKLDLSCEGAAELESGGATIIAMAVSAGK